MKVLLAFSIAALLAGLIVPPTVADISQQPSFELNSFEAEEDDSVTIVELAVEVLHAGALHVVLEPRSGLECTNNVERQATVAANQVFTAQWTMDVLSDGYHLIEVSLDLAPSAQEEPPVSTYQSFECYVTVENGVVVASSLTPDPDYIEAGEAPFDTTSALAPAFLSLASPNEGETVITVNVSGRIAFATLPTDCYAADPLRGIPGVRVVMDWDEGNTPASQWQPYWGGNVEGIDYAITDMDGFFEFSFAFSSPDDAGELADFIRVYVQHLNAAAYYGDNPSPLTDYFALFHDIDISNATNQVSTEAANVTISRTHGGPMRFLERARRYSMTQLAYTPARIRYYTNANYSSHYCPDGNCGTIPYAPGRYINFREYRGPTTAYHEYGHYIDDLFGGLVDYEVVDPHTFFLSTNHGAAWVEGWAEYFEAVVCSYWYVAEPQLPFEWDGRTAPQFLDLFAEDILDIVDPAHTLTTEGCIAMYLYTLRDSYATRATNYTGDNDELTFGARMILDACTEAEGPTPFPTPLQYLVPTLHAEMVANAPAAAASSLNAVYDWMFEQDGLPRSPTPTTLSISADTGVPDLEWNNNASPTTMQIPGGGTCTFNVSNAANNFPTSFRVMKKQTEGSWDGTLSGYSEAAVVTGATFDWQDDVFDGQPTSYVVVARNDVGQSIPKAQALVVPPAIFDSPAVDDPISDVVTVVGTVKPRSQVRGYDLEAEFTSFRIEWGIGTSPSSWSERGVTYLVSTTSTASHANLASLNTGVIPEGPCTIRIVAKYGSDEVPVERSVAVDHRTTTVAASGASFTSIQSAINWAEMGDTVSVSPGTYSGNLTLKETVVIVGNDDGVEIVGVGNAATITAVDHAWPGVISHVTIKHPSGSSGTSERAVRLQDASLVMEYCVVKDFDTGSADAAGIYATGHCNVVLDSVEISNTTGGGALMLRANANGRPTVAASRCTFRDNHEIGSASGGAVRLIYTGYPLVGSDTPPSFSTCSFIDNSAESASGSDGAGLDIRDSGRTITIDDCVFVDNVVGDAKGAAVHLSSSRARLENCTIATNLGETSGDETSGILLSEAGNILTLRSSIVAQNDGPPIVDSDEWWTNTITIADCLFDGHATDETWAAEGENCFVMDPAFCDAAAGDYDLYAFSPCVVGPGYFTERIGALGIGCVPEASVSATNTPVAACPAGDNTTELVVTVNLDDAVMTRTIGQNEITLDVLDFVAKVFDSNNTLPAFEAASSSNLFTTALKHKAFGSCGSNDAVDVLINGTPLATQASVNIRSWDLAAPYGSYSLQDFGAFGNPAYGNCRDYNNDDNVNTVDFAWFGLHYTHSSPYQPANASEGEGPTSNAAVSLAFSDDYETANSHRLLVDVSVTNFGGVTTSMFEMTTSEVRLTFVEWQPAEQSIGNVMFTPVSREGGQNVCFGIIVSEGFMGSEATLGRLVFSVTGSEPFEVGNGDFVLTYGEVLGAEDGEHVVTAQMSGVLERVLDSEVARLYYDRLEQNFPNPFNPTTTLAFSVKSAGNVSIAIYDVAGRQVRQLVNERRERGAYKVVWDGQNDAGQIVASGVYFYKLVAGSFTDTKKMTMLK